MLASLKSDSVVQSTTLFQSVLSSALLIVMTIVGIDSYRFFSQIVTNQEKILENERAIDADNKLMIKQNAEFLQIQTKMNELLKEVLADDAKLINDDNIVLGKIKGMVDLWDEHVHGKEQK